LVWPSDKFILIVLSISYIIAHSLPGNKFAAVGTVPDKDNLQKSSQVRVFHGKGRTLIPGLGDAHTHLSWNGGDLDRLGELGVEEHTLLTARSAQCYLDSGYTMYAL
jgi:imidazolonepropionase-like amidohydrolase